MLSELYKFKAKFNIEINQTVDELKRNVIIQIGIVAGAFVFFACKEAIIIFLPCFNNYANVTQNSIVAFAFMYFVLVIADTSMGLYNLIKKNSE